jgi:hypothetical protein
MKRDPLLGSAEGIETIFHIASMMPFLLEVRHFENSAQM